LEAEIRLASLAELIRADLGERQLPEADGRPAADLAEALRAYLDERVFEAPTMAEAARAIEASPTGLARAFSETFAIAPHAYLEGRRLEAARDRILAGQPLADVAAELGYVDQAHPPRRSKRFLGPPPGGSAGGRPGWGGAARGLRAGAAARSAADHRRREGSGRRSHPRRPRTGHGRREGGPHRRERDRQHE